MREARMTIKQAVLAAAAHIEANPQGYNFHCVLTPSTATDVGCMIGWTNFFFLGPYDRHDSWDEVCEALNERVKNGGGGGQVGFYDDMCQVLCNEGLIESEYYAPARLLNVPATAVAQGMRKFAERWEE